MTAPTMYRAGTEQTFPNAPGVRRPAAWADLIGTASALLRPLVVTVGVISAGATSLAVAHADPPPGPVLSPPNTVGVANIGQPGIGQPGMGQPGMGQPGIGQPGMGQPGMGQPGIGQPGMGQPGMGQPGMGQPGMGQPGFGQPGMGQPGNNGQLSNALAGMGQSICPMLVQPGASLASMASQLSGSSGLSPGIAGFVASMAIQMECPGIMTSLANGQMPQMPFPMPGLGGSPGGLNIPGQSPGGNLLAGMPFSPPGAGPAAPNPLQLPGM